jgi:hypothetical protein
MRRIMRNDELHAIQMKAIKRALSYDEMANMNRVESAAQ